MSNLDKKQDDYIIPFNIDKNKAIKIYKKYIKYKFLISKKYKNSVNNIIGEYVPIYLFDYNISGEISAICIKSNVWKSNNYKYKKNNIYDNIIDASCNLFNVPVVVNKEIFNININQIEPYDYTKLEILKDSYLKDFSFKKCDYLREDIITFANEKAKEKYEKIVFKEFLEYDDIQSNNRKLKMNVIRIKRILVPIWILEVDDKNKKKYFLINGQSGKISGKICLDKKQIILSCLMLFFIIFLLLVLIFCGVILWKN